MMFGPCRPLQTWAQQHAESITWAVVSIRNVLILILTEFHLSFEDFMQFNFVPDMK